VCYALTVIRCIDRGVRFTHYLAWSFTDNWEWREGFQTRFGIVRVDFGSKNLTRTVKDSGRWMSQHVFSKSSKK
jgi:beta-glucosidase